MNTRIFGLVLIGLILLCAYAVSADTGTYILQKQNTELVIRNTTDVVITYDVDFTVTGGNIPWVTMGLPNSNFEILSSGGAVKTIKPSNSAGWTGVRIDLDKTYLPGQTFNYKFSVLQKRFVVPYNGQASVQFTPVYWDNAPVKNMEIRFIVPENVTEVKTSDSAAIFGKDNSVTWQFTNVPNGARKTVGLTMPVNNTFPSLVGSGGSPPAPTPATTATNISLNQLVIWVVFAVCIMFVAVFVFSMFIGGSRSSRNGDYSPPELYLNSASSKKKTKRNLHLSCINDKSVMEEVLVTTEKYTRGIPAGLCLLCGALFFDKNNIEKAFKAGLKESEFNKNAVPFAEAADSQRETCPRCDGKLKYRTQTKEAITGSVYHCAECGGIWLEHGEYANVKKLFDLQKAEFAKDGKSLRSVDDDKWLFYPYIYYPYVTGGHISSSSGSSGGGSYSGGSHGGGGSSSCVASSCVASSCACVACACACACAGGGAAGCSPKDKFNQIHLYDVRRVNYQENNGVK